MMRACSVIPNQDGVGLRRRKLSVARGDHLVARDRPEDGEPAVVVQWGEMVLLGFLLEVL